MGLPHAKFSSCSGLEEFEGRKEYLSEKVAFVEKAAVGSLTEEMFGGVGKGIAEAGITQIGRLIGGAARSLKERLSLSKDRENLLDDIVTNDPIVSIFEKESPGSSIKAFSTLVKVAPTLSTDPNVATSFLRNAAQTGGTMDFATVKLLAEAESSVAKARHPEGRWMLRTEK